MRILSIQPVQLLTGVCNSVVASLTVHADKKKPTTTSAPSTIGEPAIMPKPQISTS